ncbi:uncharacterized protein A4U43_C04F5850 [Asparagus officinalis]|uniref:GDSL esterase/lipase n=1 Tax=Asparagus officinalis TaxID=4686 RepID=A0A5P1EZ86_ASPOF|nr:uncharacterized protein A4U43_C04F5850 [Asparagus officinalis]
MVQQESKGRGCSGERLRECGEVGEDALFWVGEIGANDYAYSIGSEMTPKEIREHAVKNVAIFVKALLDRGAKYIIVQGLPLTGCLPLAMILSPTTDRDDLNCSASVNTYSNLHNSLLQSKLQQLRSQYPAALISYADYYSAHRTIMKNPEAHGFNEPFKVCCGSGGGPYNFDPFATCASPKAQKACSNPRKFVNWDGVHLTEAVYKNVADMFFHQNYCRPSFSVLLSDKKNRG